MRWRHLPNALTLLRIASTPLLAIALAQDRPRAALALLLFAAATDAADGLLARRFGWQSRLGGLLDPIADKLMLNAAFLGLWHADALPGWCLALVLGRDLVIVTGALAWHRLIRPLVATPTLLGKLCTALQISLAASLIVQLGFAPAASQWTPVAVWIVAGVTLASGIDYVVRWGRKAVQQKP